MKFTGADTLYITKKIIHDKTSPFIENEGQEMFGDYNANAVYLCDFLHNNSKQPFYMEI